MSCTWTGGNTGSTTCPPNRIPACSAAIRTGADPVWMPLNVILITGTAAIFTYTIGDNFKIDFPTGSGIMLNLFEVAKELADRLRISSSGISAEQRPVFGGAEKFQHDPHWRDYHPVLRVFPWRQRRRSRRESSDGLDRPSGEADRAVRPARRETIPRVRQGWRLRSLSMHPLPAYTPTRRSRVSAPATSVSSEARRVSRPFRRRSSPRSPGVSGRTRPCSGAATPGCLRN